MKRHVFLFAVAILWNGSASAQTGFPPFASQQDGGFDSVNRQNLNTIFSVPIVNVPGRGQDFTHALINNSMAWSKSGNAWTIGTRAGWSVFKPKTFKATGSVSYQWTRILCDHPTEFQYVNYYFNYRFTDEAGTKHAPGISFYEEATACLYSPTGPRTGYTSAGHYVDASSPTLPKAKTPDGIEVVVADSKDKNGNYFTKTVASSVETQWKDTLGRIALRIVDRTTTCSYGGVSYPYCSDYIYEGPDGTDQMITVYYEAFNIKSNFGCSGVVEFTGTRTLQKKVVLPNGQSYVFDYEPTPGFSGYYTGRISKVTLPTGGYYEYIYPASQNNGVNCADGTIMRLTRKISDGTTTSTWEYARAQNGATWELTVTDPVGDESLYVFTGTSETSRKHYDGTVLSGTLLQTVNTVWGTYGPSSTTAIIPDGAQTKQTKTETIFDSFLNLTQSIEYDWGTNAPGAAARTTQATYTSYPSLNMRNLPSQILVREGGATGTIKSRTDIAYDSTALTCVTGAPQHDDATRGCSFTTRGNPTVITAYKDAAAGTGAMIQTLTYDSLGNLRTSKDNLNHTTTYSYTDSWSGSACLPPSNSFSYVTSATNAAGHVASTKYNSCLGLPAEATDPNGKTTTFSYDTMKRLIQAVRPDGGQTAISFNDTVSPFSVQVTTKIDPSQNLVTTRVFDGLGRAKEQRVDSDPEGVTHVQYTYDLVGRVWKVTNPFRSTSDPTYGVTETLYDALGRVTKVIPPDGAASSNNLTTSYGPNSVTVTDQAGKQRRTFTDALGRVIQVDEPNPTLSTPAVTAYTYDALDNLLTVVQSSSRQRTFTYDSLSQLLTANTPEGGLLTYTYDTDGNLQTRVAPAPNQTNPAVTVSTTYGYDALHRLTSKNYSDSTPDVTLTYDVATIYGNAVENPVGRLVAAEMPCHSAIYQQYDALGRVKQEKQFDPIDCGATGKTLNYTYDLAGNILTSTNGHTSTYTQTYNAAGRLTQLSSSYFDANRPPVLVSGFSYFPNGAVQAMTYGNNLYHRVDMNNRFQPCRIRTRTSAMSAVLCAAADPTGDFLQLEYGYNHGVSNNGSVMSTTASGQQSFSRSYSYDELNRLATMTWPVCNYTWTYDIWGNRTSQDATGGSGPCGEHFPTFNTKNQIADAGYSYDAAGNLIAEPGGRTYQWDAEGRLIAIDNGIVASYLYDALERRTASAVAGSPRIRYVYNLDGNVVSEFEGTLWMRGYAHAGTVLIGQYQSSQLYYTHQDILGSTRILSKVNLAVQECDDFLPYGELDVRACAQPAPPTTTIARKFTGHYRDAESGFDHTQFRKYSSTTGRWLSPDPLAGSVEDPQSLNRFSYVRNNPTNLTDPLGLCDYWTQVPSPNGGIAFICGLNTQGGDPSVLLPGGGQLALTPISSDRFPRLYPSTDRLLGWPTAARNKLSMWGAVNIEMEERRLQQQATRLRQQAQSENKFCSSSFCLGLLKASSDFSAGAGDFLTFGLTAFARSFTPGESVVDYSSNSYLVGAATGTAVQAALLRNVQSIAPRTYSFGGGGAGLNVRFTNGQFLRFDVHQLHFGGRGVRFLPHIDTNLFMKVKHFPWNFIQ